MKCSERMETTNHPSVFSRLNFDGKEEEKKNMGVEEKLRMVEAEVERRKEERRSDERRQDCEGGKMLGLRESPRKRAKDLGVSRRSSPIKKVWTMLNMKTNFVQVLSAHDFFPSSLFHETIPLQPTCSCSD